MNRIIDLVGKLSGHLSGHGKPLTADELVLHMLQFLQSLFDLGISRRQGGIGMIELADLVLKRFTHRIKHRGQKVKLITGLRLIC